MDTFILVCMLSVYQLKNEKLNLYFQMILKTKNLKSEFKNNFWLL